MIATIDPGLSACGVALWDDDRIVHATLVKSKCKTKVLSERVFWLSAAVKRYLELRPDSFAPVTTAIIELPQTYGGRAAKGDTNDLIHLALVVGALIAAVPTVHLVPPSAWKKNVPKEIMTARILGKLTDDEKSKVEFLSNHNTLDAIGLGLWWRSKKKTLT